MVPPGVKNLLLPPKNSYTLLGVAQKAYWRPWFLILGCKRLWRGMSWNILLCTGRANFRKSFSNSSRILLSNICCWSFACTSCPQKVSQIIFTVNLKIVHNFFYQIWHVATAMNAEQCAFTAPHVCTYLVMLRETKMCDNNCSILIHCMKLTWNLTLIHLAIKTWNKSNCYD